MKKEEANKDSYGGFGCGFMILCAGIATVLIIWAQAGFPKFWQ